ncbi:MAG: peptidase domain-containing ABC transporter [Clostridia bacterium]|nr:peptidase domain-containing ABC transporter [Clostridia bacterium]
MKYPHIQQHDEKDCGAACLSMITEFYGAKYPISKLRELIKVDSQGANIYGLVTGGKKLGLSAEALEGEYNELSNEIAEGKITLPFIARIINQYGYEHYIVVYDFGKSFLTVGDPAQSKIRKMNIEAFKSQWQGQIITFEPTSEFKKTNNVKGSFRKYFSYILSQKKLLVTIFILTLIVTFVNISGSIVFQYVINESLYGDMVETHDHDHDHEHEFEDYEEYDEVVTEYELSRFQLLMLDIEEKLDIVFNNLQTVCITIILMYLLRFFIEIMRGYMLALTAKKVDIPITLDYYNHLMDLPVSFFGTRNTGEFMSRFYDTSNIRDAVSTTTLTIMLDTIMTIACGALLCYINTTLFIITIVIMIIYAIIMFTFKNPIKLINHEIMEQEAHVTSYLKESIDGIETIKAYHYESNTKNKTYNLYKKFINKNVRASITYIIQESLVSLTESIGVVILLWSGAMLCVKNVISIADLIIFYYLINYFLDPVKNLINLQPELQTAMVAAERLNDILDVEIENNDKEKVDKLKGDIVCKDIDFRYGYRNLVLKDVSMTFKSGTKTAIVGESGCGKTTLAKLIMQFYTPEKGSITVNGTNLADASQESVRQRISYISQDIFLFSDTVYNNLRIGNSQITDEEITEMCKKCGADEFINNLPMGYKTVLEENGNNLSGGQKQRLAIARALLKKPDILIMDEATSNLDTVTEQSIKNLIDSLSEEITCIIIAHRLTTIKSCDYIYVMDKGTVVESGTHQELLEKNGMYKQLTDNI